MILIEQLERFKIESTTRKFELNEVKAVGELIRSVQMLENQTEREQEKVLKALENATPEELSQMERDAARLLQPQATSEDLARGTPEGSSP
jgi:hypothetical protein